MPRQYRASIRAASTASTRGQILDAARRILPGGVDIPVDQIAAVAGVSVQTLYTHFGSKRGLLMAVIDAVQREAGLYADFDRVWQSPDGETALRRMLDATFQIWDGAWPFVEFSERARRTDPEILRYLREVDGYRLGNLRSITEQLALEGRLLASLDAAAAADLAFAFSTPSTYDQLVRVRRWPLDRATKAVIESVVAGLIDPRVPPSDGPPADWSSVHRPGEGATLGDPASGQGGPRS